jgi:hypothetical protein
MKLYYLIFSSGYSMKINSSNVSLSDFFVAHNIPLYNMEAEELSDLLQYLKPDINLPSYYKGQALVLKEFYTEQARMTEFLLKAPELKVNV